MIYHVLVYGIFINKANSTKLTKKNLFSSIHMFLRMFNHIWFSPKLSSTLVTIDSSLLNSRRCVCCEHVLTLDI